MTGEYINLTEAAKRSPGRPHSASIWRWMRKGVLSRSGERITLDHIRAAIELRAPAVGLGVAGASGQVIQPPVPAIDACDVQRCRNHLDEFQQS